MDWCTNLEELQDFIGYVVLCAPADFPEEDGLDLDGAFAELLHGIDCSAEDIGAQSRVDKCKRLLDESLSAYKSGDDVRGAHILQQIDRLLTH